MTSFFKIRIDPAALLLVICVFSVSLAARAQPPDSQIFTGSMRLYLNDVQRPGVLRARWSKDNKLIFAIIEADFATLEDALRLRKEAVLWNAANAEMIGSLPCQADGVFNATLSPDGANIVGITAFEADEKTGISTWGSSANLEGKMISHFYRSEMQLWNVGQVLRHESAVPLKLPIETQGDAPLIFSPDSQNIVICKSHRAPLSWNTQTGRKLQFAEDARFNSSLSELIIKSLAYSNDGKFLAGGAEKIQDDGATAHSAGEIILWNGETGKLERTFECDGGITGVQFSQDAKLLITIGASRRKYEIVKMGGGKYYASSPAPQKASCEIAMRSVDSGQVRFAFKEISDSPLAFALSPDGTTLAIGSSSERIEQIDATTTAHLGTTGTIKLWDAQTGKLRAALNGHQGPITSLDFSSDGKRILSASGDGTMKIWDTIFGKPLVTLASVQSHGSRSCTEWIAYTEQGYYQGSPDAEKFINWAMEDQQLDMTTHRQFFHRPDLVRKILDAP